MDPTHGTRTGLSRVKVKALDVAPDVVRELMARGATGAQLTELNAAVQQDVALGVKPVAALELRSRGVMSLLPPPASVLSAQRP